MNKEFNRIADLLILTNAGSISGGFPVYAKETGP